jgi:hypothetical protein
VTSSETRHSGTENQINCTDIKGSRVDDSPLKSGGEGRKKKWEDEATNKVGALGGGE